MLNWVRTWIELFKINEWGKDMQIDSEIRFFCARSAPDYFFSKILVPATWRDVGMNPMLSGLRI